MTFTLRPCFTLLAALFALAACGATPTPDYAIKLSPAPDGHGLVATQPACPSWHDVALAADENVAWPQFGCATARNLAAQVERPSDLVRGRPTEPANPEKTAAAMERYLANQTTPLIDPNAAAPVAPVSSGSAPAGGGGASSSGTTP